MHKRTPRKIFGRATPSWRTAQCWRTASHRRRAREELHRNMSPAEAKLWKHLRAHRMSDIHFRNHTCLICLANHGRRQGHAIGNYIVDFSQRDAVLCAPRRKLIIELDGSQHLEQAEYDEERTRYLETRGYKVLRFWNNDVMNQLETVLQTIWKTLNDGEKGQSKATSQRE